MQKSSLPDCLQEIPRPPKHLYIKGNRALLEQPSIAIVGTRRPTPYGERVAAELADGLARAGFVIVSGLAFGIDSIAHKAALAAGGLTIGVLAGGLDVVLQSWQRTLVGAIIDGGGAILSEQPPGTPPLKYHFRERNRIIAGLSHGTIIVEARDKSGALLTANFALESNRTVFAVPGDIDRETAAGPLRLLRQGAVLVRDVGDVLAEIAAPTTTEQHTHPQHRLSSDLVAALAAASINQPTPEMLSGSLNRPVTDILTELSRLELAGVVTRQTNGSFALASHVKKRMRV